MQRHIARQAAGLARRAAALSEGGCASRGPLASIACAQVVSCAAESAAVGCPTPSLPQAAAAATAAAWRSGLHSWAATAQQPATPAAARTTWQQRQQRQQQQHRGFASAQAEPVASSSSSGGGDSGLTVSDAAVQRLKELAGEVGLSQVGLGEEETGSLTGARFSAVLL